MEGYATTECVVSIRIRLLIGLFMLFWLWSRYSVIMAAAQKFQTSAVRFPRSRPCPPEAPFKEKAIAGERVSILSFRLADPASSLRSFPTFLSLLPLSKENFELALGFTFIVSCGVAKRKPFNLAFSHKKALEIRSRAGQTCHGTRLAKVKSW